MRVVETPAKLEVVLHPMLLEERNTEADVGEAPREAGQLDDSHLTEAELSSTQKSSP